MANEGEKPLGWTTGVSWGVGIAIIILTLAIWVFFYVMHMALDPESTTVVALAMAVLVIGGRFIWSRMKKAPKAAPSEIKK